MENTIGNVLDELLAKIEAASKPAAKKVRVIQEGKSLLQRFATQFEGDHTDVNVLPAEAQGCHLYLLQTSMDRYWYEQQLRNLHSSRSFKYATSEGFGECTIKFTKGHLFFAQAKKLDEGKDKTVRSGYPDLAMLLSHLSSAGFTYKCDEARAAQLTLNRNKVFEYLYGENSAKILRAEDLAEDEEVALCLCPGTQKRAREGTRKSKRQSCAKRQKVDPDVKATEQLRGKFSFEVDVLIYKRSDSADLGDHEAFEDLSIDECRRRARRLVMSQYDVSKSYANKIAIVALVIQGIAELEEDEAEVQADSDDEYAIVDDDVVEFDTVGEIDESDEAAVAQHAAQKAMELLDEQEVESDSDSDSDSDSESDVEFELEDD